MAGDWIKIEHWTQDKPEVFQMADLLNIDPDAVLGKLIRVWVWADQQTTNGNAGVTLDALQDRCINVTRSLLDRLAGVPGFASAMEKVGWLKSDDAGLWFSNFERHNGETAKTRALTAKRVQKHRAKKGNATVTPAALPREEKRREEDKATTDVVASPEPADETEIVLTFPVSGTKTQAKEWHLRESLIREFAEAFPGVEIERECRRAHAWIMANPSKKKTAAGMRKYLTTWMMKEQDRGGLKSHNGNGQPASNGHKPRTGPKVLTEEDCELLNKVGEQEFLRLKGTPD